MADETNSPWSRLPGPKRLNERLRNLVLVQTADDAADQSDMLLFCWVKFDGIDLRSQYLERKLPPCRVDFALVKVRKHYCRLGVFWRQLSQ